MISKRDIIEIAHPDVKGTKVIELSTLRELRQQLKDKFKTSIYNYDEAEQFINDVLCVEGESNEQEKG